MLKFIKDRIPSFKAEPGVHAVIAVLIAVVLIGCSGTHRPNDPSEKQMTFILYGNDDPEDLEILQQRLDLFAGREGYSLEQTGGTYTLRLPASLCRSDRFLTNCLEELLISPCRISAACSSPRADDFLSLAKVNTVAQLAPENCRGMKVEELSANNEISGEDGPLMLDMKTPPTRRLILKFDEDTAKRLRTAIDKGCNLCLTDNNLYSDHETNYDTARWNLNASPDDPCSFYIDYSETYFLYGNEDLFYYNLTHNALSHPYNYCVVDEIIWEDPEENTSSGSNQCREDALEDSFLYFQLSSSDKLSADTRAQARMMLLRRLDLLGSSYAFGHTADGAICVKIQSPHINMAVLTLLSSCSRSPMRLTVPGSSKFLSTEYMHVHYDPDASAYEVSLPTDAVSDLNDLLHGQMQSSAVKSAPFQQIPIFLCVGTTPVAQCITDVFFDPSHITFREIYIPEDIRDIPWFTALVQESANIHQTIVPDLAIDYLYYHDSQGNTFGKSVKFPLGQRSPVSESEMAAKMQKILPQAQVQLSDDSGTLTIRMNLQVDEKLISQIFSLVPELFRASTMRKQYFDQVLVYPFEPVDDERCLLSFIKEADGNISFRGYLCNGRLTPYKEEIEKAIEQDSFFKSMINGHGSGWVYRDF